MPMTRNLTLAILGATLVAQAGCATLFTGTRQQINVNSTPQGATVSVDGMQVGTTPWTGEVKKGDGKVLILAKDGYQSQTVYMPTSTEGWFWGNIISCGVSGSITDYASGAMYKYSPNTYTANLAPLH